MAKYEGGCLCGAVRYSTDAEPSMASYCHCRMCQKATGGAFSICANFPTAAVIWSGPRKLRRSSPFAVRGFCPECGSPLSFQYDDSDHVSINVGTLDNPELVRPGSHGGVESRWSWIHIDEHLPAERTDDDPEYRQALEESGWRPPGF